jgi:hypothetical protein
MSELDLYAAFGAFLGALIATLLVERITDARRLRRDRDAFRQMHDQLRQRRPRA